jgi:hypothetical protein
LSAVLGAALSQISLRGASNIVTARQTASKILVAWSDYGYLFYGRLTQCTVPPSLLECSASINITTAPIHHDPQSLAVDAIYSTEFFMAWKQGVSPFIGHAQACNMLGVCGPELQIKVEWGCVAVATLAQTIVVVAYSDVQVGHRGSIMRCSVANMNLNCDIAKVFEQMPITAIALAALTDDDLPYDAQTTDLLIGYQVSSPAQHSGRIQACILATDGLSIECYAQSFSEFNAAPSLGLSLMTLTATTFVVGYADQTLFCPTTDRVTRRRAAHVCTLDDGHPVIGRMKMCRATFRGLGISSPVLECGTSGVLDDGYRTGVPHLAKSSATPGQFLATYACTGCGDLDHQGFARPCTAPTTISTNGIPPTPTCSERLIVHGNATQLPKAAAITGGYIAVFDDYAGGQYLSARYITV